jgi:hypothetical protein
VVDDHNIISPQENDTAVVVSVVSGHHRHQPSDKPLDHKQLVMDVELDCDDSFSYSLVEVVLCVKSVWVCSGDTAGINEG